MIHEALPWVKCRQKKVIVARPKYRIRLITKGRTDWLVSPKTMLTKTTGISTSKYAYCQRSKPAHRGSRYGLRASARAFLRFHSHFRGSQQSCLGQSGPNGGGIVSSVSTAGIVIGCVLLLEMPRVKFGRQSNCWMPKLWKANSCSSLNSSR